MGFSIAAFYRCFFFFFSFSFFLAKSVIPTQNNGQHTIDATNCNQQNNCQHSTVPNQLPANKTSPLPKDCIAQIIYINKTSSQQKIFTSQNAYPSRIFYITKNCQQIVVLKPSGEKILTYRCTCYVLNEAL